jgi:hypothetical protein
MDARGQNTVNIQHSAPDFATLRSQCAVDIDAYIRPLFRDLQLESVMAADVAVACRVLAEDLAPDVPALAKVRKLVADLDDDSFRIQQHAVNDLAEMGLPMAVAVAHLDRDRLSPQQNVLLDSALSRFQAQATPNVAQLGKDPAFLLDCLYLDNDLLRAAALKRLTLVANEPLSFDNKADAPARARQIDRLRTHLKQPSPKPRQPL